MLAGFLPGLRDDDVTVLFPTASYGTRLIPAIDGRLIELHFLSQ
jgi:hypothetical protein